MIRTFATAKNITEWNGAKIEHHGKNMNNKRCVIIVPAYKNDLPEVEVLALKQVVKILGNKYEIVLVCPSTLDVKKYNEVAKYDFSVLRCPDCYFKSQKTYSDLCENWEFYDALIEYEYMVIYQLDAWIFEDKLEYFMNMGYDYIGGVHLVTHTKEGENGNGGFCLRKVKIFRDVCKKTNFSKIPNGQLEDCAFTQALKNNFNLAPVNICRQFSFQEMPATQFKKNGNKLPMGCHAWRKFNKGFWLPYIMPGEIKEQLQAMPSKTLTGIYGDDVAANFREKIKRTDNSKLNKKVLIRKFR